MRHDGLSQGRRFLAVALAAASALGAPPAVPRSRDDDLMPLQLRLGASVLDEALPGLPFGDTLRLPLGQLCQDLELAVEVDPGQGRADGFLIQEQRRFHLDLRAGTCTVGGVAQPFFRDQVEVRPDDLYVDTRLLAQWLPVDLEVVPRAGSGRAGPSPPSTGRRTPIGWQRSPPST